MALSRPLKALYLPTGQEKHAVVPLIGENVPAVQGVHNGAPPVLNVPAAQLKQAALDELPELELYVPAVQLVHSLAPPVANLPAAHSARPPLLSGQKNPAEQLRQAPGEG